jgi:hypothetical protein
VKLQAGLGVETRFETVSDVPKRRSELPRLRPKVDSEPMATYRYVRTCIPTAGRWSARFRHDCTSAWPRKPPHDVRIGER